LIDIVMAVAWLGWHGLRSPEPQPTVSGKAASRHARSPQGHVTWDAARSKWKAQIALNHLKINVGRFDSELEAAAAYDAAAKRYFGEFANVNLR
jgi:AP2 domain